MTFNQLHLLVRERFFPNIVNQIVILVSFGKLLLDAATKSLGDYPEEVSHTLLGIAFWRVDTSIIPNSIQGIFDGWDTTSDVTKRHLRHFWKNDVELFKMPVQNTCSVIQTLVLLSKILLLNKRFPDLKLVNRLQDALELVDVIVKLAQLRSSLPGFHYQGGSQLVDHLNEVRLLGCLLLDQRVENFLHQVV